MDANKVEEDIGALVGGVWLPRTEVHLADMMHGKRKRVIDGKLTYQYHKLEFAVKHCKKRRTAIDIGAHVGLWAMHLINEFEFVHCFEPVGTHAALLLRNMPDDARLRYRLHAVALGNRDERGLSIRAPSQTTGNAHILESTARHPGTRHVANPDEAVRYDDIDMRRLDTYGLDNVDFVKIDVEGYELDVVRGAEEMFRKNSPVVVVEQKGNDSYYGHRKDSAAHLLQDWGYMPLRIMAGDWIMQKP